VPTGKAVGAEVRGVDFSQPVPEDAKEALRRAWSEYLVLLFRDQEISTVSGRNREMTRNGTIEFGARLSTDMEHPDMLVSDRDSRGEGATGPSCARQRSRVMKRSKVRRRGRTSGRFKRNSFLFGHSCTATQRLLRLHRIEAPREPRRFCRRCPRRRAPP
jgi:hypothetical protein